MRWFVLAIAACGSSSAPTAPVGPPASMIARARGPDDVVVAQVDGRPVWASCVAAQAKARGLDAKAALRECIDFELLAQAAEKRGVASDGEVAIATRGALVNELVAQAYEAAYQHPQDFGDAWAKLAGKQVSRIDHDEYRGSTYVRVELADNATPAQDAEAHALADKIAAALVSEAGLMPQHFVAIAQGIAGKVALKTEDVPPYMEHALDKAYGSTLFAIPEIGRSSPAVRTKWGWDIVLLTDIVPPSHPPEDEIVRELLPGVQQAYFPAWVNKVGRSLGVHVEVDKDASARLERMQ
jgi:hypothetical protein